MPDSGSVKPELGPVEATIPLAELVFIGSKLPQLSVKKTPELRMDAKPLSSGNEYSLHLGRGKEKRMARDWTVGIASKEEGSFLMWDGTSRGTVPEQGHPLGRRQQGMDQLHCLQSELMGLFHALRARN